jgi:hypothetical protein
MNDFFQKLYEMFGIAYNQGFSDNLYNAGTYAPIGELMFLLALAGMAIYYYAINHPRFNRWYHWLVIVLILCAANFGIAFSQAYSAIDKMFQEQNQAIPYPIMNFVEFSFINVFWTLIFCLIISLIIKWGSRNAKYSPL